METNIVLKQHNYLVSYSVGAKREKFIVTNHTKVPDELLIEMGYNKIESEINTMYEINSILVSEKKFKNKLRKDSFVEIEYLNELKIYNVSLNFNSDGTAKNEYSDTAAA